MNTIRKLFNKISFRFTRSAKIFPTEFNSIVIPAANKVSCSICFESSSQLCQTNCGHRYHKNCIEESLKYNTKCPNCRGQISHYSYKKKQIAVFPEPPKETVESYSPKRLFTEKIDHLFEYCTSLNIQPYIERFCNIRIPIITPLYNCLYKYFYIVRILWYLFIFVSVILLLYLYFILGAITYSIYCIFYPFALIADFVILYAE